MNIGLQQQAAKNSLAIFKGKISSLKDVRQINATVKTIDEEEKFELYKKYDHPTTSKALSIKRKRRGITELKRNNNKKRKTIDDNRKKGGKSKYGSNSMDKRRPYKRKKKKY